MLSCIGRKCISCSTYYQRWLARSSKKYLSGIITSSSWTLRPTRSSISSTLLLVHVPGKKKYEKRCKASKLKACPAGFLDAVSIPIANENCSCFDTTMIWLCIHITRLEDVESYPTKLDFEIDEISDVVNIEMLQILWWWLEHGGREEPCQLSLPMWLTSIHETTETLNSFYKSSWLECLSKECLKFITGNIPCKCNPKFLICQSSRRVETQARAELTMNMDIDRMQSRI